MLRRVPAALLLCLLQSPLPDPATPGRGNPALDVQRYELHLALFPPEPRLAAVARIEWVAREPLRTLELDLHHQLRVQSAQVDHESTHWSSRNDRLRIELARPAEAGSAHVAEIVYGGELPADESQGEPVGLLPDAQGLVSYLEPDGAHQFYPCNDHPSDKARFDVYLSVPCGVFAAATGALRGYSLHPFGQTWHWGTDHPTATYLLGVAAGRYAAIVRPGPVPVLDLAWPEDEDTVRHSLEQTGAMMAFLAERYGPYPFERYGHVYNSRPVGGLEDQTMTVFGRDAGLGGDPDLVVHELGHQWFGDCVSPRQWRDLWLNEGWATYLELRWAEARDGAAGRQRTLAPWRSSTLRLAERKARWTLADPDPQELFAADLVYHKGGMVLYLLDRYLGRERWDAAARHYLEAHRDGSAGTADFQQALEDSSGEPLGDFFRAWVEDNRVPEIQVQLHVTRKGAGFHAVAELRQTQPGAYLPLAAVLRFASADGAQQAEAAVRFTAASAAAAADLDFEPARAELDPDRELPWKPAR